MTNQEERAAERVADLETQNPPDQMDAGKYLAWLASNATPVSKTEDGLFHEDDDRLTNEECVKVYYDGRAAGVEWLQYMCSLDGISVQSLSPNDLV